jgi:hypothetical protein
MTELVTREQLHQIADILPAPRTAKAPTPHTTDRSFELPTGLYVATAVLYFGVIGVMSLAFMNPSLAIPMAICAVFIAMFFGTCAKWVTMRPDSRARAMTYGAFRRGGIATATGRLTAGEATVQVLILPVLIFAWAIAVAVIAAVVG